MCWVNQSGLQSAGPREGGRLGVSAAGGGLVLIVLFEDLEFRLLIEKLGLAVCTDKPHVIPAKKSGKSSRKSAKISRKSAKSEFCLPIEKLVPAVHTAKSACRSCLRRKSSENHQKIIRKSAKLSGAKAKQAKRKQ